MDAYECVVSLLTFKFLYSLLYGSKGLNIQQAAFAVKKYKSHRHVGRDVMMNCKARGMVQLMNYGGKSMM